MDFAFQGPKGYQKDEVQDLSTALPASDRATYSKFHAWFLLLS